MSESDQATTIGIIDRLARLEGMLVVLQNGIGQSQQQWSSAQQKAELLEQRVVRLEAAQITKDDVKDLAKKVDALINKEAQASGGVGVVGWALKHGAAWVAIVISLFAVNEAAVSRRSAPVPPPPLERVR